MRFILSASLLLSLLPLLGGCFSRGDALAPVVTMDPPSGTVRRVGNLDVTGYALDDEGIVSIRINNTDLLATPQFQSEKGKKLIQFGFRPAAQGDQFVSKVVVEDTSGNVTQRDYGLQIDTVPPSLEINEVVRISDSRLRVRGVARDNDLVKSITVAGQSPPFVAINEREFSLDVDITDNMTIEVEDRAGNVISEPLVP